MEYKHDKNLRASEQEYPRTSQQYTAYSSDERRPRVTPKKVSIGKKEDSIFDLCLGNPEEKEAARKAAGEEGLQFVNNVRRAVPGFFAPFESKKEFAISAAAPIVAPIVLSIASAASVIVAAGASLTALGSLVFAAGSGLHSLRQPEAKETTHEALTIAKKAGIVAAACAAVTLAAAILAVVLAPVALAYFLTRSGATIVHGVSSCLPNCSSEENEELEASYRIGATN